MEFPFLLDFSPPKTRIEILRRDIQHKQPDVPASIFIDADAIVDRYDQEKVYVPEEGRLVCLS
jgi:hypothetical protein